MIGCLPRLLARAVALVLALAVAVVALLRSTGWDPGSLLGMAGALAAPYAVGLGVVGLLVAALARARLSLVLCLLATGALALAQAPLLVPDGATAERPALVVMTSNTQFGRVDAAGLAAAVARERVDVLAVQELTPDLVRRLGAAGLDRTLPHRHLIAEEGAGGTGLWSRLPLGSRGALPGFTFRHPVAEVEVEGAMVTVAAVHPRRPELRSSRGWVHEHEVLRARLAAVPDPVVAAGDFNATLDHLPMRRLGEDGFVDAADSAGAGLLRTWPLDLPGGVPVLGLDHVLVRGGWRAVRTAVVPLGGTDHAALVAELRPDA